MYGFGMAYPVYRMTTRRLRPAIACVLASDLKDAASARNHAFIVRHITNKNRKNTLPAAK